MIREVYCGAFRQELPIEVLRYINVKPSTELNKETCIRSYSR